MTCCACGAGRWLPLPAWFARTTQSPCFLKLTDAPEIEQIAALAGAMLNVTARADVAVAVDEVVVAVAVAAGAAVAMVAAAAGG